MSKEMSVLGKCVKGAYENREMSWLSFNKRVLDQAMDLTNPLLERCKFLSIFISNLDEFIQVRLGTLVNQSANDPTARENKTEMTAREQVDAILAKELLKRFGVSNIIVSDLGVKEGALKQIVAGQRQAVALEPGGTR